MTARRLGQLAIIVVTLLVMAACNDEVDAPEVGEDETPADEEELATPEDTEDPADTEATEVGDEPFPVDPVTIIVAFGPGGANDTITRRFAPVFAEHLGVDVVVENVEGGAGAIGTTEAFERPADGGTLVMLNPPTEYLLSLDGVVPYEMDDFDMLGAVSTDPGVVAVNADSPHETLQDLLDAAQQEPVTVAHTGERALQGIAANMLMDRLDMPITHVPYDSGAEFTAAVMGGHVDFGLRNGGWYDHHPDELRILAVAGTERIPQLEDVPTIAEETGTEVVFEALRGFGVRADTPEPIRDQLREAFEAAAQDSAFVDGFFEDVGFLHEFVPSTELDERLDRQFQMVDEILGAQ